MGSRGRPSAASFSVVTNVVELVQRPKPPSDLTKEEKREWRAIVDRMPADWFPRETHSLLAQLCRHIVAARKVAQLIDAYLQVERPNVKDLDRLYKMQERESRTIASLSVKLRISLSSQYDKSKKRGPVTPKKPWESSE